jgi:hypothetical protein
MASVSFKDELGVMASVITVCFAYVIALEESPLKPAMVNSLYAILW